MSEENLKKHEHLYKQIKCNNLFSKAECQKIISSGSSFAQYQAKLAGSILDNNVRETKVRHLKRVPEFYWLWDRINSCILQTNKQFFQFNITGLTELQLLEYEEGGFYDWHVDLGESGITSTRKISIIVFLSDTADYEGGQISWDPSNEGKLNLLPVELGTMILFPSYQIHKVMPVTRGKRFTLVGWAHGNPFL